MRRGTVAIAVVAIIGLLNLVSAASSGAATSSVDIQDFSFAPQTVTVQLGDTVTWTNLGQSPHSVTADDDSFDSSPDCPGTCLQSDDTFSFTFTSAGTFPYHCRLHGADGGLGMAGVVIVQAPGTTTTTGATTTTTAGATTTTSAVTTTTAGSATTTVAPGGTGATGATGATGSTAATPVSASPSFTG